MPLCLTLLTDYGPETGFVGALHTVAFNIAPDAHVIDLDHSLPPGNVRLGALRLERFARLLPVGAHVGVVDPGVGGTRRPIAIAAGNHYLVGPDNGLLIWAAERLGGIDRVVLLDDPRYHLGKRSRTFDGRDIFVPVAAHLLSGTRLEEVGSPIAPDHLKRLERPVAITSRDGSLFVEVLQVDGFGNVQFGANADDVARLGLREGDRVMIALADGGPAVAAIYGATFGDVPRGETVMLLDSDGQLALSVNGGRADAVFDEPQGTFARISRAPG
ncbi:MAG: SAM-dependent chlorinase/fluorinase [Acidimicrobiales bacterium]